MGCLHPILLLGLAALLQYPLSSNGAGYNYGYNGKFAFTIFCTFFNNHLKWVINKNTINKSSAKLRAVNHIDYKIFSDFIILIFLPLHSYRFQLHLIEIIAKMQPCRTKAKSLSSNLEANKKVCHCLAAIIAVQHAVTLSWSLFARIHSNSAVEQVVSGAYFTRSIVCICCGCCCPELSKFVH